MEQLDTYCQRTEKAVAFFSAPTEPCCLLVQEVAQSAGGPGAGNTITSNNRLRLFLCLTAQQ